MKLPFSNYSSAVWTGLTWRLEDKRGRWKTERLKGSVSILCFRHLSFLPVKFAWLLSNQVSRRHSIFTSLVLLLESVFSVECSKHIVHSFCPWFIRAYNVVLVLYDFTDSLKYKTRKLQYAVNVKPRSQPLRPNKRQNILDIFKNTQICVFIFKHLLRWIDELETLKNSLTSGYFIEYHHKLSSVIQPLSVWWIRRWVHIYDKHDFLSRNIRTNPVLRPRFAMPVERAWPLC